MRTLLIASLSLFSTAAWADPIPTERPQPSLSQEKIYRALSVRDPVPSCETVEGMSETPVADLLFVVEHAQQPPWTAMRAAQCLVRRHATTVQPQIESWVSQESTRGLALMTLGLIDSLPMTVALPVAQRALEGPLASDAKSRLLKSALPEIQKLAQ